jgi:hypothetical protein
LVKRNPIVAIPIAILVFVEPVRSAETGSIRGANVREAAVILNGGGMSIREGRQLSWQKEN